MTLPHSKSIKILPTHTSYYRRRQPSIVSCRHLHPLNVLPVWSLLRSNCLRGGSKLIATVHSSTKCSYLNPKLPSWPMMSCPPHWKKLRKILTRLHPILDRSKLPLVCSRLRVSRETWLSRLPQPPQSSLFAFKLSFTPFSC